MSFLSGIIIGLTVGEVTAITLIALLSANRKPKPPVKGAVFCKDCLKYQKEQHYCFEFGDKTAENDYCTAKGVKYDKKH